MSSAASSVQGALNGQGSALDLVLETAEDVTVQGTTSQCDSFLVRRFEQLSLHFAKRL